MCSTIFHNINTLGPQRDWISHRWARGRKAAPMAPCKHSAPQPEWREELHTGARAVGQALMGTSCVHVWGKAKGTHSWGAMGEGKQKRNPSVGRAAIVGSQVTQQRTEAPSANALLQGIVTGYNALPLLKRPLLTKIYQWKYNKRSYFASAFINCVPQRKKKSSLKKTCTTQITWYCCMRKKKRYQKVGFTGFGFKVFSPYPEMDSGLIFLE